MYAAVLFCESQVSNIVKLRMNKNRMEWLQIRKYCLFFLSYFMFNSIPEYFSLRFHTNANFAESTVYFICWLEFEAAIGIYICKFYQCDCNCSYRLQSISSNIWAHRTYWPICWLPYTILKPSGSKVTSFSKLKTL